MSSKPHAMLFAIALACIAAVAWAADAPRPAAANAAQPAIAGHSAVAANAAVFDDDDDFDTDFDGADLDAGGPGVDRHVFMHRGGRGGGAGCGPMAGGRGMRGGARGCGAGGCGMGPGGMGGEGGAGGCGMSPGGMGGPGMGGRGMGPGGGMLGHAFQMLDLSDAQRQKLADIHERQARRGIQARADLQIARLDLHKAMSAEKPEGAAIYTQIDRMAKLRTDMAKARVATMLEARALLTPEQQKKLQELRAKGPGACGPNGPGNCGLGSGPGPMGGRGMGMGAGPGAMGGHGMGMGPGGHPMRARAMRDTLIQR